VIEPFLICLPVIICAAVAVPAVATPIPTRNATAVVGATRIFFMLASSGRVERRQMSLHRTTAGR